MNLIGQKIGLLTVLKLDEIKVKETGRPYWICRCECGKIVTKRQDYLRRTTDTIKSCGCQSYKNRSSKKENLVGHTFGRLTVLEEDLEGKARTSRICWKCKCECGKEVSVRADYLKSGATKSCGCYQKSLGPTNGEKAKLTLTQDLRGQKFGKLTVIDLNKELSEKGSGAFWNCLCDCGNKKIVKASNLKNGDTKSCGCLKSFGETKISYLLNEMNIPYVKEYTFADLKGDNANLRFDFAIIENDKIKCLIEYQGEQHYKENPYFGGEERFKKQQKYDELKRKYCEKNKIKLVEIPYWELEEINEEYLKRCIT